MADLLDQVHAQTQQGPSGGAPPTAAAPQPQTQPQASGPSVTGDLLDQVHANLIDNPQNKYVGMDSSGSFPVYQSPGSALVGETVVNPAKQAASGAMSAAAGANHLTANIFDLLDKGADMFAHVTGTDKGGAFHAIADWARGQEQAQRQTADKLSGGRQDLPSQIMRGGVEGALELPQYAIAGETLGPAAGVGAVSALNESDKGFWESMKAAASGAATGGALTVMGPASRAIRLTGAGAMTYAKARLEGKDNTTALAEATTMGGMNAMAPGGKTLGQAIPDAANSYLDAGADRAGGRIKSSLNPVQQEAIDDLRQNNVPMTAGTQSGNKFLRASEAVTANTPLGSVAAGDFNRGTEEALTRRGNELANEAHPAPMTPESAGNAVKFQLQKNIADTSLERDAAYNDAWTGQGEPEFTHKVPVRREPVLDSEGKPTGKVRQVLKDVNMPVDIRDIKEQAAPIYDEMKWTLTPSDQSSNPGFNAIQNLLKSDDFVPAWQAEHALGGLKTMARVKSESGVRNTSQGIAASIIKPLQEGIDGAVAETGDNALRGLQRGRALHASVMEIADLADHLSQEPVQAFKKLIWQHDTGIDFLRKVSKQAPDVMRKVGRAFVQQLFDTATEKGGFSRTDGLWKTWSNLGDETKRILFPEAQLRRSLDNFFMGAQMISENPNKSGTALVQKATSLDPLKWAAGWAGGKILFTPIGIARLTRNLREAASARAASGKAAPSMTPPPE